MDIGQQRLPEEPGDLHAQEAPGGDPEGWVDYPLLKQCIYVSICLLQNKSKWSKCCFNNLLATEGSHFLFPGVK